MNRLIQLNKATVVFFVWLGSAVFLPFAVARAVSPPLGGDYDSKNNGS